MNKEEVLCEVTPPLTTHSTRDSFIFVRAIVVERQSMLTGDFPASAAFGGECIA